MSTMQQETAGAGVPSATLDGHDVAMTPAHLLLIRKAMAIWEVRALYAAIELSLVDILADRPMSVNELALRSGTHAPSLSRLLRALGSLQILTESSAGVFSVAPLGAALRRGAPGSAREALLTLAGDWQWQAWGQFMHSLRTGETGLRAAAGVTLFDFLATHPRESADFDQAMVAMYKDVASAIVACYPFTGIDSIVDLGGGTGWLIAAILSTYPRLSGVVFELPATVPRARSYLACAGLSERCAVVEGDFFESVPSGHQAYLLAHVLHDWTDEQAHVILRRCRAAMAPGSRLLIVEAVLPAGDTPHHGKLLDLLMMTVTGGSERTGEQFGSLLASAGLRLTRIVPLPTHQSVIEAEPA